MSTAERSDINPDKALEAAVDLSRHALADYRAGVLDEAELRRILFRAGLVQWPDEAWLLDLRNNEWRRYDGLGLGSSVPLDAMGVAELRTVLDELAEEGE